MAGILSPRGNIPQDLLNKFLDLVTKPADVQGEFFLKSFIFALGDNWKDIPRMATEYSKYLQQTGEGKPDLNAAQASDFLQKHGKTRTAIQRRDELKDIDLDKNDRICYIEYLLLAYKKMILEEYYKRTGEHCPHDLSNDGIGVTGVGAQLLDELFTMPEGLDPALAKAIEDFTASKRARESKMKDLEDTAAKGGVKGLTAKNELEQMKAADTTEMNRIEITLNAAKKRASKNSGEQALAEKKKAEEAEKQKKLQDGRNKLKNIAAAFEQK